MAGAKGGPAVEAGALDEGVRRGVRDLILVLADSKRLLGYRYAEWMLGAPELETGIACSSMTQDEWGHARLLYALLKEFDDDVDALEHGREAKEYRNLELLDQPAATWPDAVALMALADAAISVQLEALLDSSHDPLRQRVEKLLDEERFHAAHGAAWFRRLAGGGDAAKGALRTAVEAALPPILRWFGPDGGQGAELREAGVVDASGAELRGRFLDRSGELLDLIDVDGGSYVPTDADFADFDPSTRRSTAAPGPDPETIAKIRGDRNRAFLMD